MKRKHNVSSSPAKGNKKKASTRSLTRSPSKKSARSPAALSVEEYAPPPPASRCTSIVLLDSGGWTVKHGMCGVTKAPQQVPNAVARLKHQLATLVADEIDTRVKNKSQLVVTRPYERGYCTNLYCLLQVWTRILVDLYGIPIPAPHVCLILLTPPFMPTVLEDAIDQTVFTDLGCGRCIKLFLPSMAAYRYLYHNPTITAATTSNTEAEEDNTIATNFQAPYSFDGTQCCCVVDSGFSFTHIIPTIDTKAVVRNFIHVVLFTIT